MRPSLFSSLPALLLLYIQCVHLSAPRLNLVKLSTDATYNTIHTVRFLVLVSNSRLCGGHARPALAPDVFE